MVGVAAVALLAGAGGAAIATSGSSSAAAVGQATPASSASSGTGSSSPPSFRRPAAGAPFGPGRFARGGGIRGAVHGQLVVPAPGGGYQTVDIQTGKVTAVGSSSLSVHSADGYSKTYRVTGSSKVDAGASSLSAVKVGDQVSVTATVSGSTATVTSIIDLSIVGGVPGGGNQGPSSG